ncbi:uncharacterized protein LOC128962768 [Oppia nitens]|uniref:uncharacterized protein LOC128962768 n=1 Tax=Oppia nitens TaxID=1686743 RepID=UPI0023DB4541|nr:uncharacterized protein LOC128962768 [Oppia nitens]
MKAIIYLIAVLLLLVLSAIKSVVSNKSSKNFCDEYRKNGHKIDVVFRFSEDNNYDKTESNKYFFIDNNCWQLTYSDGFQKTVTMDTFNTIDKFDTFSGKIYSMAWTIRIKIDAYFDAIGALRKDLKNIDWWHKDFPSNFKPTLAWTPLNITKDYPIVTFMDNNNNNDVKTRVYNFSTYDKPIDNIYGLSEKQKFFIEGKQEIKINSVTKLMAIVRQYSRYDFVNGKGGEMGGQGSIVFTNDGDNSVIKYCYVGNPFNETACKPNNLKTLIKCSPKSTTTTPKTTATHKTTSIPKTTTVITTTTAVLLLLVLSAIKSVVSNKSSKNFCNEYVKNGYKIDFVFRFFEDNKYVKTESNKYFIIGNNCWQLTYSDGFKKSVTMNMFKTIDKFDTFSGKIYSMAWTTSIKLEDYFDAIGALRKDLKNIDWWHKGMNYGINFFDTSTIDFTSNFKPTLAWTPMNITEDYLIVTFMDNNNNNDVKTRVYNFSSYYKPIDNIYGLSEKQKFFIEGKQEIKINSVTKLMAIVRQYSRYDYANGKGGEMGGQGSIVFTNVGDKTAIKYCYVGNPFNETACKPKNLKTLIKCFPKTTTTIPKTTTTPKTTSLSMTTSIPKTTTIPTLTGTQTNGTNNWFKWLKTTFLIVVNVILLILICLMTYLVYKQWLKRCTK